jgi:superfamily II DNA helicase RecQ
MQYKFFTFPITSFDIMEEELNKFLRSHQVVEIEKHLLSNPQPMWCFCVGYLQSRQMDNSPSPKVNYEQILDKNEFAQYERLRELRKQVAQDLKIPAYAVFTNKELAELSKHETINKELLLNLDGFGQGRMEKIGVHFLSKFT